MKLYGGIDLHSNNNIFQFSGLKYCSPAFSKARLKTLYQFY